MDIVWVLAQSYDYEGEEALSVHRSLEGAKAAGEAHAREWLKESSSLETPFVAEMKEEEPGRYWLAVGRQWPERPGVWERHESYLLLRFELQD